jgi:L-lactate permease
MAKMLSAVLFAGAVLAVQASLHATVNPDVPEISPGTLSTGLAALAAGVLVARARWRSK